MPIFLKHVVLAAALVAAGASAQAGFSIAVKTLRPAAQPAAAPVPDAPAAAPEATSVKEDPNLVRLVVPKAAQLNAVASAFAQQHGWNVAWLAGDIVAGDTKTFQGKSHEETLVEFMRHYELVGERYASEKGYVIRRSSKEGAAKK